MPDLTELAQLCDEVVGEPVIVVGSPPTDGRDLDLLARPSAAAALEAGLAAAGLIGIGGTWARFGECKAEVVEVLPASEWGLPGSAVDQLFASAQPLNPFRHLLQPAPQHVLLIVAWRTMGDPEALTPRRYARVENALRDDPDAWVAARAEAEAWSLAGAVADLERNWTAGAGDGRRTGPSGEEGTRPQHHRRHPVASKLRSAAHLARRRRPIVVAFSGLDGSGKTTQARSLVAALDALGHPATLEWSRLTYDPAVERVARPVKQVLTATGLLRRPQPGLGSVEPGTAGSSADVDVAVDPSLAEPPIGDQSGRRLRERSRLVHHTWTAVIAVLNARGHRAAARRGASRGAIVVRDRYVVDSLVQLRDTYGRGRRLPFQEWLLERLAPRPLRAYFLDVPPEEAFERKGDYPVADLARHRSTYLAVLDGRDVKVLDGLRPTAELCAQIAEDVWRAVEERQR